MKTLLLLLAINWNADLTHLATELPKIHPDPFAVTTREAFLAEIEQLRARAPEMQPHEVIVDMARIVATIGEGHTRVLPPIDDAYALFHPHVHNPLPKNAALHFHALPVRFTIHADRLFTTDGQPVARIGRMTAEEAMAAVKPVIHADNDFQRQDLLAAYLSIPEVLHARKVTASLKEVPVTFGDGSTVVYAPLPEPPPPPPPLTPWSFTYLPNEKAVWFQYDEVSNTDQERLSSFAKRMFRFIDEHPVEKLIIDVRNNYGGNGGLNRSLIHGLIRADKLQTPGSVVVLIGRRTYSAAIMFAVDVEKHIPHAIFIGEPSGGTPNSFGDPKTVVLPESGVIVRVSGLYWQSSHPRDKRPAIVPQIAAPPSFEGDAAREAALDLYGKPATLEGKWRGTVKIAWQRADFQLVDGKVTSQALKIQNVPLAESPYKFDLQAGSKRLIGTMTAEGNEFLVVAEREP